MIRRLPATLLSLFIASGTWAANSTCQFEQVPVGPQKQGPWIDKSNWLAIENQRLTLQAGELFMPAWRLAPTGDGQITTAKQRPIDDFQVVDPLDGSSRDLAFLLDSRLYVDGLVVLRNGRVVAERYRNGLTPDKPRLLLQATRPLLNLLGAMSVSQGKLAADKSVSRFLPKMAPSAGLRKLSIRRLLENEQRHSWTSEDLESWQQAGGWTTNQAGNGIRAWLAQAGRWEKPLGEPETNTFAANPDDDLLAWVLAESNAMPLSRLFCEGLLSRNPPEHSALWVSDSQGVELASGLGLSLRDFAKLGQLLVEARSSRNRAKIPSWFIEALVASSGMRLTEIKGLSKGSEQRYGFVHLGGAPNRVALFGAHGTSLYIDFDKRLIIAFYATRPGEITPETLALLEHTWKAIDRAIALLATSVSQ
uniref:Beta-lactamase n=1 Tax=Dechloromonas aromatica (strain RCB) TaxID=159087 RepID=Q47E73_DECAR